MKWIVAAGSIFFVTTTAYADDWCLPANECTGEPSPIQNNQYDTCEETCRMRDPVPVRGLEAKLYDVKCEGDSSSSEFRMMLGEYTDFHGNRLAYLVTPDGAEQLERCPL